MRRPITSCIWIGSACNPPQPLAPLRSEALHSKINLNGSGVALVWYKKMARKGLLLLAHAAQLALLGSRAAAALLALGRHGHLLALAHRAADHLGGAEEAL